MREMITTLPDTGVGCVTGRCGTPKAGVSSDHPGRLAVMAGVRALKAAVAVGLETADFTGHRLRRARHFDCQEWGFP